MRPALWRRVISCVGLHMPEIDAGEVVHAHLTVLLVGVEEFTELLHHGRVICMAFGGGERTAAKAAAQRVPVENLVIRQVALREGAQEAADALRLGIGVLHVFVIDAKALKNIFVRAGERRLLHAPIVPSDDHPAARLEDANEFASGSVGLEPVKGLSGGDEINASVVERGGFGGAFNAGEAIVGGEIFFAGLPHVLIGLNAVDAIAIVQEKLAQKAGAGADVGNHMAGAKAAFGAQKVEQRGRVAGAVADVVLEEDLDIVDAVLEHGQAIDAHAEGEAADFFRVVFDEAVDGGIYHAGAEKFNPAGAFALRAGAAAENAGNIEFDARLGEREITGAEARFHAGAEKLFDEIFDGAGEIAKGDVGVDREALDLMEDERVRGVGIVAAIDLAAN